MCRRTGGRPRTFARRDARARGRHPLRGGQRARLPSARGPAGLARALVQGRLGDQEGRRRAVLAHERHERAPEGRGAPRAAAGGQGEDRLLVHARRGRAARDPGLFVHAAGRGVDGPAVEDAEPQGHVQTSRERRHPRDGREGDGGLGGVRRDRAHADVRRRPRAGHRHPGQLALGRDVLAPPRHARAEDVEEGRDADVRVHRLRRRAARGEGAARTGSRSPTARRSRPGARSTSRGWASPTRRPASTAG